MPAVLVTSHLGDVLIQGRGQAGAWEEALFDAGRCKRLAYRWFGRKQDGLQVEHVLFTDLKPEQRPLSMATDIAGLATEHRRIIDAL